MINNKAANVIEVTEVSKTFQVGIQEVQVLKNVTFNVGEGDFVIIFGPSGSGKSTILHTLLGLEPPSTGSIKFLGEAIYENTDEDYRSEFRKQHIGMVYQQPNWVKSLTVKENVAFPLLLLGQEQELAYAKAIELLKTVELIEWAEYRPTELSGGQQQRVALARALVNDPQIIIADEPTGNLDYENGQNIMQLFYDLNHKQGKTVIMVTHDLEYLPYSNTAVHIFDGTVDGVYQGDKKKDLLSKVRFKRGADYEGTTGKKSDPTGTAPEALDITHEPEKA